MLSRVADSIFWMSRYIERAANVARFIHVNLKLAIDLGPTTGGQWASLVYTTGDQDDFAERYGDPDQRKVIEFLAFDQANPNSIVSCLRQARENARTVREMISSLMWEELNKFFLTVRSAANEHGAVENPFDFFQQVILTGHLLSGINDGTMSHGEPWHFTRLGRFLERADKTSRILDVKYYILLPSVADVGTAVDTIQWSALLESASALEMYRKRHGRITPDKVADFLILDREFPRAMHYCLIEAEKSLASITGNPGGDRIYTPAEQQLGRLRSDLNYSRIDEIIKLGLHEFIDQFQDRLNEVGEAIHETFFAPHPVPAPATQSQMQ
ncbi:MAG TPA: alpha-E domain-containing protein [Pirellulaceae bacterium]|nr:alpha-E domain-containing protein [Pirellulaceae bacterium]